MRARRYSDVYIYSHGPLYTKCGRHRDELSDILLVLLLRKSKSVTRRGSCTRTIVQASLLHRANSRLHFCVGEVGSPGASTADEGQLMCTNSCGFESVRAASRCSRAPPYYPSTHTSASWREVYQKTRPAMPSSGHQLRPKSLTWPAAVRELNSPSGLFGPLST